MPLVAVLLASLIALAAAAAALASRGAGCPGHTTCAAAEAPTTWDADHGPEQRYAFMHVASPDMAAVATTTMSTVPFVDSSVQPARMLRTINPLAVRGMTYESALPPLPPEG